MTTLVDTPGAAPTARTAGTGTTREPRRIAWSTALPLAVVATLGNEFWLISLRGAIGAIERAQGPFMAWVQESALLMPLYLFAVLAALALAMRRFGPRPLSARALVVTVLLVALAATLAALAVQAANAVHDYRLQVQHVANMALHMPTCDAACVTDREESALALQVSALGLNGLVMLVSNVLLLGLLVAFRGGRLDIASPRRASGRPPRFESVELFLMVALLGTAAIQATLVREQLARWPLLGIAMLLLTIAQVDTALLFLLRLRSAQFLAAAAVSAAPPLVWLYSRTAGLPFGPRAGTAGEIGLTDATVALLEVVTLVVAIVALRSRRVRGVARTEHAVKAAVVGVVAVTVAGMAVGVGLLGGERATKLQQGDHIHTGSAVVGADPAGRAA